MTIKLKKGLGLKLIIFVIILISIISFAITVYASSQKESSVPTIMGNNISSLISDGEVEELADDVLYEEMMNKTLISYKSDSYVYLYDENSLELQAIILIDKFNGASSEKINSNENAIDYARSIISAAYPNIVLEDYDVTCSSYGFDETNTIYSIELLEKVSDDIYGGKRISVIVTSDGVLESFLCLNTGIPDSEIESFEELISEDEAISIAYDAVSLEIDKMLTFEYEDVEPPKTGTDEMVSDSGYVMSETEVVEPYEIYINETINHEIYSHKECLEDTIVWVVRIENISTNRIWQACFEVRINATSGEVLSVDTTR